MNLFKQPYWSPYIAGLLIGLLQIPIFWLLHASLGASGSFNSIACAVLSYLGYYAEPNTVANCFPMLKNWWQLGFVFGIVGGAFISSRLSNVRRRDFSPIWIKVANISSIRKRFLMAFVGGFIMILGARLADGCTVEMVFLVLLCFL